MAPTQYRRISNLKEMKNGCAAMGVPGGSISTPEDVTGPRGGAGGSAGPQARGEGDEGAYRARLQAKGVYEPRQYPFKQAGTSQCGRHLADRPALAARGSLSAWRTPRTAAFTSMRTFGSVCWTWTSSSSPRRCRRVPPGPHGAPRLRRPATLTWCWLLFAAGQLRDVHLEPLAIARARRQVRIGDRPAGTGFPCGHPSLLKLTPAPQRRSGPHASYVLLPQVDKIENEKLRAVGLRNRASALNEVSSGTAPPPLWDCDCLACGRAVTYNSPGLATAAGEEAEAEGTGAEACGEAGGA